MNADLNAQEMIYKHHCRSCLKRVDPQKTYNERADICAGCTKLLRKVDVFRLLDFYYDESKDTRQYADAEKQKKEFYGKGKATELNKAQIRKILQCYLNGASIYRITKDMQLQHRTVKNVINRSFKSQASNEKVEEVYRELMGRK